MKKAIWFSRHQPTAGQLDDASCMGFEISVTTEMTALASLSIETDADVDRIDNALQDAHCAVFGVFAAPLQERLTACAQAEVLDTAENQPDERAIWSPCFSAWNLTRTPEGGKPTFTHHKWVLVGKI
jgi:hypothetical protein